MHARQRVHQAVEAAVREAAELAERSGADGDARLRMLVDGWGRALTAALEELAVSLDELRRLVTPPEPEPAPVPATRPAAPPEPAGPPPAATEANEDEDEEQLRARAAASRAETEALREETP